MPPQSDPSYKSHEDTARCVMLANMCLSPSVGVLSLLVLAHALVVTMKQTLLTWDTQQMENKVTVIQQCHEAM